MPEVGGDAVLWTDLEADPAVVAELLALAVSDEGLPAELARRGAARVAAYEYEATAGKLRAAIDAARSRPASA